MSQADAPHANLANFVDGLVAFLRTRHQHKTSSASAPVPEELGRVFDTFADHLVALMLVAGSDDKVVDVEREVILRYCEQRASKQGLKFTSEEVTALDDYLRYFRPTMTQMISAVDAIERLRHGTKDEVADLIAAARAVVEADGVLRLQEVLFLSSLQRDLHAS